MGMGEWSLRARIVSFFPGSLRGRAKLSALLGERHTNIVRC